MSGIRTVRAAQAGRQGRDDGPDRRCRPSLARAIGRAPGILYIFAYDWNGGRYTAQATAIIDPLFLDDRQTRVAALVVEGGAQLIFQNLYPLILTKADRNRIEQDAARLAAVPTGDGSLGTLEAQSPEGARRDYVHFYRAIGTAEGRQRRKLTWKRHKAAERLPPNEVDAMLSDCRQHTRPA